MSIKVIPLQRSSDTLMRLPLEKSQAPKSPFSAEIRTRTSLLPSFSVAQPTLFLRMLSVLLMMVSTLLSQLLRISASLLAAVLLKFTSHTLLLNSLRPSQALISMLLRSSVRPSRSFPEPFPKMPVSRLRRLLPSFTLRPPNLRFLALTLAMGLSRT